MRVEIKSWFTDFTLLWSACHKKSYLTNLEVRNLKSEISCLCPVGSLSFLSTLKKKSKWILHNLKLRHITNSFSYDMPTTFMHNFRGQNRLNYVCQSLKSVFIILEIHTFVMMMFIRFDSDDRKAQNTTIWIWQMDPKFFPTFWNWILDWILDWILYWILYWILDFH